MLLGLTHRRFEPSQGWRAGVQIRAPRNQAFHSSRTTMPDRCVVPFGISATARAIHPPDNSAQSSCAACFQQLSHPASSRQGSGLVNLDGVFVSGLLLEWRCWLWLHQSRYQGWNSDMAHEVWATSDRSNSQEYSWKSCLRRLSKLGVTFRLKEKPTHTRMHAQKS